MEFDLPKILVLDANQRSALAVTRSLGRSGEYLVNTADSVLSALAGASRYSQTYHQYPDPNRHPAEFIEWVRDFSTKNRFDLFMPTTEVTSQLLLQYHSDLPDVQLPFATHDKVMKLADKVALVELAQTLGITVPKSRVYQSKADVESSDLIFPLVIKPALSQLFRKDHWIHTQVRVVKNHNEWAQALREMPYLGYSPFMLQEFIAGHGSGIFCLYDRGQPVRFFAHQRLREKPPEGGVSVLSRSVPVADDLKGVAEQLLNAIGWHGVAMVEFRISHEGEPYLMEVNTRFWGSLQLAIDAGVDFPLMLTRVHLKRPNTPDSGYLDGQRLRWLLGDLDSLYIFLKRKHPMREKLKRILAFMAVSFRGQKHEVNRLNDLRPAWVELKQYLKAVRHS